MSSPRTPCHSREEWEEWKAAIGRMYLDENKTCKEIKTYLDRAQFGCTERQIKNRLSEWKFECKKTPAQHYMAMLSVTIALAHQGFDVVFDVPKRLAREDFTVKKVKKECDRIRKKCDKDRTTFTIPSIETAEQALCDANIHWTAVTQEDQPGLIAQPCSHLDVTIDAYRSEQQQAAANLYEYTRSHEYPTRDRESPSHRFATIHTSPESSYRSSPDSSGSQKNSPRSPSSPGTVYSDDSPEASQPNRSPIGLLAARPPPDVEIPNSSMALLSTKCGYGDKGDSLCRSTSAPYGIPEATCSVGNHISALSCKTSNTGKLPSANAQILAKILDTRAEVSQISNLYCKPEPSEDFDFSEALDSMKVEDNHNSTWNRSDGVSISVKPTTSNHKMNACRWAAPYYSQCFKNNFDKTTVDRSKVQAMQMLKQCLKEDNPWVYPCLIWMVLVLGSHCRMQELASFVHASCEIIDEDPNMHDSFTFAAPFHYTLAFTTGNDGDMNHWGDCLPRAYEQIQHIWGERHPNFLVIAHFYAWHQLRRGNYDCGIPLLRRCLPICEQVMGRHSLVTINGLVMISRALEETQNFRWAIDYLQTALDRLNGQRPDLEKFRLTLLQRLAELKLRHTDDLQTAEAQLFNVLYGRGFLGGLDERSTWSTVHSLCEVFNKTGRARQAIELLDYCTKRLDWERTRDWCIEHQKEAPPPPWWWPCELHEITGEQSSFLFN
ncbi:hypothetical protein LTR10_021465 [Elasticomyces elasticus]|uniref:Clr5 domain-containing protein n=1 Tax=Exophiala sideris TaxID=1016849 RepID=A0ABR0J975_9EURO|nr:hypothetical protein LTR10_021465 [Elasticomyces elasticus]KAK5027828.1 hypothetical protein LTS07_006703 [Exophiala sideris]KAK5037583.1 hypothetical protein LTR13_004741 [Exophiala sideris]KAK5059244.1 hypothetical protein LTR69_006534 [Exophiala sideris]KAK5183078.1 hypothetical protein LTR44_004789 [Eurotiomycetes sp. CCFEE 6388]